MPSSRKLRAFDITFYYSTEEKKLRISRPNHRNCRRKSRESPGSCRADCTSFSIKICAVFSYFPRSMCFSRAFCCSGRPHKTPSAPGSCFLYEYTLSFWEKQFCFRQSCRTYGFGHVFSPFPPVLPALPCALRRALQCVLQLYKYNNRPVYSAIPEADGPGLRTGAVMSDFFCAEIRHDLPPGTPAGARAKFPIFLTIFRFFFCAVFIAPCGCSGGAFGPLHKKM